MSLHLWPSVLSHSSLSYLSQSSGGMPLTSSTLPTGLVSAFCLSLYAPRYLLACQCAGTDSVAIEGVPACPRGYSVHCCVGVNLRPRLFHYPPPQGSLCHCNTRISPRSQVHKSIYSLAQRMESRPTYSSSRLDDADGHWCDIGSPPVHDREFYRG